VTPIVALTRAVSPAFDRCELTHLARVPIDVSIARRQHDAYERVLAGLGCRVTRLEAGTEFPDAVFIEDTAIVLDEVAIVTRPGAASRRGETAAVAGALGAYRPVVRIEAPATIDGGDVVVAGRRVFVGGSTRTNPAAVDTMRAILGPHGYTVEQVEVRGCLHLKSAVTPLADDVLLLNSAWVDAAAFAGFDRVDVDPGEPGAANAMRVGPTIVCAAAFPGTLARIASVGFEVVPVDVSELAKAEGAVTCCSLVFRAGV
jgi:dimethylargininase